MVPPLPIVVVHTDRNIVGRDIRKDRSQGGEDKRAVLQVELRDLIRLCGRETVEQQHGRRVARDAGRVVDWGIHYRGFNGDVPTIKFTSDLALVGGQSNKTTRGQSD